MPPRRLLAPGLFFACAVFPILLQAQSALQFVPVVPPCRVVDTRGDNGPFGGPAISGNASRDFAIPQGACNIPSSAAAYAFNVTVTVPNGVLRYLTIWPTGQIQPNISTLNSLDGRTKANAAVVPAGNGGAVSVYVKDTSNVILDINGYFVPATSSTWAFFPLTPCRIADTRGTDGTFGGPYLSGGAQRIFPITQSSCQIPNAATAYSLNFTALPRTGHLGYLTVWPTAPGNPPTVSTLNAPTGTATANAALIPGGEQGAISVYATQDTDLLIDINGYFAPSTADPQQALSLYTLPPCRVLDTRPPNGNGSFVGTLPVAVLESPCNVPSAQAYVLNATVIPKNHGFFGYLSLWPDAEGQPVVSTLNAQDGYVTSNMAIVPTLDGDVDAYASQPGDLVLDIFSYFAPIMPLTITTTSLPSATVNYNYSTTVGASGGVMPYTWSLSSGALPLGLNLDPASGVISGTPTMSGDSSFNVQVTDAELPAMASVRVLDIDVSSSIQPLSVVTASLPAGTQNAGYNTMLAATGGITPYTWSISSGSLPAGLQLKTSTGAITGTPAGAGVSNFTVQVVDSEGPPITASRALSLTIDAAVPLSIMTTSLPAGTAGTAYSAPITAIGGVYPYTWSVISGTLPGGLNLNPSTGVISGMPTYAGTSPFTVQVADSETPSVSATAQLSIVINPSGGGNLGLLSGNYAFYLNGFNSSGAWTLAGSFISNGNGVITSGMIDYNSLTGQPINTSVSGNYSISTTGLNLITLQGQSWGPVTFSFVLDSTGNGRIIEYDDTTGQGSRGSGALRKATSSAFSLGALNGGWTLGIAGNDRTGRFVDVGVFTLNAGNMTNGACAVNDTGDYNTCTFSGSLSAIDPQTGRGTSTNQNSFGDTRHQVIYVVSANELVMGMTDAVPGTGIPVGVGEVSKQSGTFNNGSLNGTSVMVMQAIHGSDGLDQSVAGILTTDGQGNLAVPIMDEDLAGTIKQDAPQQGTYTVQSNGAFSFQCQNGGCPVGFLFGQNKGVMIGTGSSTMFGPFGPQTGGPFSNASFAGSYAGGALAPLDYANAENELDVGTADGAGTFVISGDSSRSGGLDQWFGHVINYSIAANGRGTAEAVGDQHPAVVYMISPTLFVVLMPSPDAEVVIFQH